jgi:hypothetical protein
LKTVGPVTNSVPGAVNQSLSCSVFGSSATMALALPSPVAVPGPIAANNEPPVPKAMRPTIGPPLLFHETTGFCSLARSIAHTAFGAPAQLLLVVA